MKKVRITKSSEVGRKCFEWAYNNFSNKFEFIEDDTIEVDVLFSVFHNKLFKDEELKLFKIGYNFHGGSLPDYRGSSSPVWCIINGEAKTSVTVHKLIEKLDSGDIYLKNDIAIENDDTGESLYIKLSHLAFTIFKDNFLMLMNNEIKPLPKDNSKIDRIYYRKDLENVKNITNLVRALHHSKKEKAFYINKFGQKIELSYD